MWRDAAESIKAIGDKKRRTEIVRSVTEYLEKLPRTKMTPDRRKVKRLFGNLAKGKRLPPDILSANSLEDISAI